LERFKELISELELVLLHCSFNAAKFRCPLTLSMGPDEHLVDGETKLFQAYEAHPVSGLISSLTTTRKIIDDGFEHNLSLLQDNKCGAIRLLASVQSGELSRCPVWTAFGVFLSYSCMLMLIDSMAKDNNSYPPECFPAMDGPQKLTQDLA